MKFKTNDIATLAEPWELFHKIINDVPGAIEGKLFGAPCIKSTNGKAAAIFWKNDMLFKLEEKDRKVVFELDGAAVGAHLYDPGSQ